MLLYFHCCNFRANMKRNKNQTIWPARAPSPLRGLPQQTGAPCLRQDFGRCQGSNPHFFPEPCGRPTPSVTSSAYPLVRMPTFFFSFCCGAVAAKVLVLQGGRSQGWKGGGKSRSVKQTLAQTDHLLAKLLIPLGC